MADLRFTYNGKSNESFEHLSKDILKQKLKETDWAGLSSIELIISSLNSLKFDFNGDKGFFFLHLNGHDFVNENEYTNKKVISEAFIMFLLEKNRFKISMPFEPSELKRAPRPDKSYHDEIPLPKKKAKIQPPKQSSETLEDMFKKLKKDFSPSNRNAPRPNNPPRKQAKKSEGIKFNFWWLIAIGYILFKVFMRN